MLLDLQLTTPSFLTMATFLTLPHSVGPKFLTQASVPGVTEPVNGALEERT